MTSDAKRSHLGSAVDRISILPRNLIDLILERLPVLDASRTSVLSNTWKNIWRNHPQLVFDKIFFSKLAANDNIGTDLHPVSKTISNILLLHSGPILKFHLSIPEYLPLNECHDSDIWIKYISNSGVRKLELINKPQVAYKLPSYLFSCLELTDLRLDNFILHPPLGFVAFRNLISVNLVNIIITADMLFGTQLKQLYINSCSGLEHLRRQFSDNNNLTMLKIFDCEEFNCQWFECTKHVQNFGLMLKDVPYSAVKFLSLDKLFGNMPNIHILRLDGYLLDVLDPVAADMNILGTTLENLKSLHLYRIIFNDSAQIKYVLCLIKSSPNLRYLHIKMEEIYMEFVRSTDNDLLVLKSLKEYLQSPDFFGLVFDQLETVKIVQMASNEIELQFIKFLLASSPSLKWMKLVGDSTINDPKEVYRISRELMRFPRASSAAQIIWT